MIALIIVFVAVLTLLLAMLWLFCFVFVRRKNSGVDDIDSKTNDYLDKYRPVIKKGLGFICEQPHQEVKCISYDGLSLSGSLYDRGTDKTAILFHGYRSSATRDFSCAVRLYCDMGFNVLLVDQRSHGKSEGKIITFGIKESRDVLSWVDLIVNCYGTESEILLGGMSMGATTVLMASGHKLPANVKWIVADCGFTSPTEIIEKVAKQYTAFNSSVLISVLDIFCRIFGGFSMKGVSTTTALKASKIPVLLIHGRSDGFVPFTMSEAAYKSAECKKQLVLVENADHGLSYLIDTELVTAAIRDFIGEKHNIQQENTE